MKIDSSMDEQTLRFIELVEALTPEARKLLGKLLKAFAEDRITIDGAWRQVRDFIRAERIS
jgi:hypothetical protein